MGDVPPGKVNTSPGIADTTAPTSDPPNVSTRPTPAPGSTSVSLPSRPVGRHSSPKGGRGHGQYGQSPTPLNMNHMAYTLPRPPSQASPFEQHSPHQYIPSIHPQGAIYPMQPMGPYPGPNPGGSVPYGLPYAPPYPPYGVPQHPGSPIQHGSVHYQPYGSVQPVPGPGQVPVYGSGYYPPAPYTAPYGPGGHVPGGSMQPPSGFPPYQVGPSGSPVTDPSVRRDAGKTPAGFEYDVSKTIVDGSNPKKSAQAQSHLAGVLSSSPSTPNRPGTPRGPPRKPKQSGHALWVGNLPTGTGVLDLKDHFAQDATEDIESVFLISKSNCAFVNYKSATACATALQRFHDSRFHGVRLVCRLRKGFTVPGSGPPVPTDDVPTTTLPGPEGQGTSEAVSTGPQDPPTRMPERYFVVKSLTVEDLEMSKQSGIWATQNHNEASLNRAYETSDNVYLIFSANKSGEYFGYARMISPINDDEALALEMPTRPEPVPSSAPEETDMTLTAATATAPKGRIIDDSARGTIFWEVESSSGDELDTRSEPSVVAEAEEEGQSFGKPFRIQWLSTERVPFHRTRGLRNPWNANREVKIARDGTEIEPAIGRKLAQLFHLPARP
ncbi:uncharacterized protein PFLUO_LOCUS1985 [Penicillium psychrofluorescens]|uniref:uncharacterized protein n=1 Tax=Penicillium psychrofluorescens TaxID=3158075 RepID=UPI003CCD4E41